MPNGLASGFEPLIQDGRDNVGYRAFRKRPKVGVYPYPVGAAVNAGCLLDPTACRTECAATGMQNIHCPQGWISVRDICLAVERCLGISEGLTTQVVPD